MNGRLAAQGVDLEAMPLTTMLDLAYAQMVDHLRPREGQTMEQALTELENEFGVRAWAVPGREVRSVPEREQGAPSWWLGVEEASDSFLSLMGVSLDGNG